MNRYQARLAKLCSPNRENAFLQIHIIGFQIARLADTQARYRQQPLAGSDGPDRAGRAPTATVARPQAVAGPHRRYISTGVPAQADEVASHSVEPRFVNRARSSGEQIRV